MLSSVNQRFKEIRFELNFTQNKFAELIGVTQNFVSRIEKDETDIPTDCLARIIKEFKINPNWLLFGEGEMQGSSQVQTQTQFALPPGYVLMAIQDMIKYITAQKPTSDEK
jgi:transcriptional regulator with XRE-family HTH domain